MVVQIINNCVLPPNHLFINLYIIIFASLKNKFVQWLIYIIVYLNACN